MRQQFKTNLPEQDDLYPLQVQLKDDQWHVFDANTGGWSKEGFDTYKQAEALAREWAHQRKVSAVSRLDWLFNRKSKLTANPKFELVERPDRRVACDGCAFNDGYTVTTDCLAHACHQTELPEGHPLKNSTRPLYWVKKEKA